MKPKSNKIITPAPYYYIGFECSNREFYEVKNEIYNLAQERGLEYSDLAKETCDYEGDLSEIRIGNYCCDSKQLIKDIMSYYLIDEDIAGQDLVLSMW